MYLRVNCKTTRTRPTLARKKCLFIFYYTHTTLSYFFRTCVAQYVIICIFMNLNVKLYIFCYRENKLFSISNVIQVNKSEVQDVYSKHSDIPIQTHRCIVSQYLAGATQCKYIVIEADANLIWPLHFYCLNPRAVLIQK